MKRTFTFIVVYAFVLLLSGCLQNFKNRDCPAFNHPLAKQWQPVESGNSIVMTNTDGDSTVYLLQSIILNEPYVASVDVNSSALDSPICKMTSTHIFSSEDGSHEIYWYFTQRDTDGVNPAEDFLALAIEASLPVTDSVEAGPVFSYFRAVELSTLLTGSSDDESNPKFIASRLLENGRTYSDVIAFPGMSMPPEPEFEQYFIKEIMISRNVGLIQLSRENGDVYTVVPE